MGVLPKQIKPADVTKVLYQLRLVPDRRTPEQSSFTPPERARRGRRGASLRRASSKPLTDSALREHFAELRRALVAGVDTQTDRITAEVRALLLESLPQPAPRRAGREQRRCRRCGARRRTRRGRGCGAAAALALALASTVLWWRNRAGTARA